MLTIQLTPYRSVFKCREKSLKKKRKIFIRISDADGYKNTRDFLILTDIKTIARDFLTF